ncbi:cilia- and flagella-associated protein 61-like [Pseudomyrmex gracilis]|uniref:cilia- and flagella-associated protein 61-like n=1 Tax=Pseudomyrmex gracilis TaxID=219809 RepID=UPI000994E5F9|nr:cilia- and flagella-associated protein 61-like [Pseudomyrmex gracilis]
MKHTTKFSSTITKYVLEKVRFSICVIYLVSCLKRARLSLLPWIKVDIAVTNAILRSGVRIFSEWNMIDWTLKSDDNGKLMIKSVAIKKRDETKILNCDALFNFDEKTINSEAFSAFCRAGLVFDGLLVIDLQHRTNDPSIFAAGTVTKWSRRFRIDSWHHEHYDSVEIGEKLAQILRGMIDADRQDKQIPDLLSPLSKKEVHLPLPAYRAPVVIACVLPGNYYYLHVRKPGKKPRRGITISDNSYGEIFATGSCKSEIGYFRIRLNTWNSVETVTCFSGKIFRVRDMIALHGKHESMLNELRFRFRNSCIPDFYAYFREPWAAAILHDRFEYLRIENRAILLSQNDTHDDSLVNNCVNALIKSDWKAISKEDSRYIEFKYASSTYRQELERNLLNFLIFWEDDFPMYYTPYKKRQMYMNVEESPLYFEQ